MVLVDFKKWIIYHIDYFQLYLIVFPSIEMSSNLLLNSWFHTKRKFCLNSIEVYICPRGRFLFLLPLEVFLIISALDYEREIHIPDTKCIHQTCEENTKPYFFN